MNWIPLEKELPESGTRVIFSWINCQGFRRTSIGYYAGTRILDASDWWNGDVDYELLDYSEEEDKEYVPEGWYEEGAEGEYCYPQSGVTHWMPLPPKPEDEQNETQG